MKFLIQKEVLAQHLSIVSGPASTKQNFPILNSVLISCEEGKLKLTTTDLDITVISFLESTLIEPGKIAVPTKRFTAIIKELPQSEILVETNKNTLLIKCEKVEFKLPTLDPDEFPHIEEEKKATLIKIQCSVLEEIIRMTAFCAGHEDSNYILNGILFELQEDIIQLIATDGKRLSFAVGKLPANQPEIKTKISFILPIKAINELYKLIKEKDIEVFLSVEENKVTFDFKNTRFIARPIEGEFPNYSQYIPKENKEKLTVNKQQFLLALRRADLLSTQDYQGITIELKKESIVISKTTPQLGEVKEVLEAVYSGAPLSIGFNPTYLIDVLRIIPEEEVSLEFFGPDKPAVLRKPGYIYLALPLKM